MTAVAAAIQYSYSTSSVFFIIVAWVGLVKLFSCHLNMLTKCYNVLYSFLFILVFPTEGVKNAQQIRVFTVFFLCIVLCAKD